jgi:hypothetical protein
MRSRQPLEGYQRAFVASWALLGLALVGVGAFTLPAHSSSFGGADLSLFGPGLLFLFVALFYARAWFAYRAVISLAGIVLGLYGIALVLFGAPYVGGFVVAIPGALVCFAIGTWSLVLAVTEPSRARAGAG